MTLDFSDFLVSGSSADLFAPQVSGKVYKLFRCGENERSNRISRAVFKAEHEAYEKCRLNNELRRHVPEFFGRVRVDAVVGTEGENLSDNYLLDCCYATEMLSGEERKVFGVPKSLFPQILDLLKRFEDAGVKHVADSSVFGWEDPDNMKLIDIATFDVLAAYY